MMAEKVYTLPAGARKIAPKTGETSRPIPPKTQNPSNLPVYIQFPPERCNRILPENGRS